MKYDVRFLIMLDASEDASTIMNRILKRCSQGSRSKLYSSDMRGNFIEVVPNEDYDLERVDEGDEGEFYRYRLEVTPVSDDVTEAQQIELIRELEQLTAENNWKTFPCAFFKYPP